MTDEAPMPSDEDAPSGPRLVEGPWGDTAQARLPATLNAERECLAAVLVEPAQIDIVAGILTPSDWYLERHRLVWEAMQAVHERGAAVDVVTVRAEMEARGTWEKAGGGGTLSALLDRAGTTSNVGHYALLVHDCGTLRRLIDAARDTEHEAMAAGPHDVEDVASKALRRIHEVTEAATRHQMRSLADAVSANQAYLLEGSEDPRHAGLLTGLPGVDALFDGLPRKLVAVVARPKMGKTAFALDLVSRWSVRRPEPYKGLVCSLEMLEDELLARMVARESGVPLSALVSRSSVREHDVAGAVQAMDVVRNMPVQLDCKPGLSAQQVRMRAYEAHRRMGGLDYVVVDHFHLMDHYAGGSAKDRPDIAMARSSGILRDLAKELGVCVLLLAQLNRKVEERTDKRPVMSDIRECGALEQDAHMILSPFWPWKAYGEKDEMHDREHVDLLVLANRNGPSQGVNLRFDAPRMRYRPA